MGKSNKNKKESLTTQTQTQPSTTTTITTDQNMQPKTTNTSIPKKKTIKRKTSVKGFYLSHILNKILGQS